MRATLFVFAVLISLFPFGRLLGDTLRFVGDHNLECTVLQDSENTVVVLHNLSILRFPRSGVVAVDRATAESFSTDSAHASTRRTPDYRSIIVRLAAQKWATDLRQIPATVIGVGVMRNVPYKSHRVAGDYEINVYGDPESPAGFEIGVRGGLLADNEAKANCVEFVTSLLSNADDKSTARKLKSDQDLVSRDGLTFEITPPTAEDSYGGWWISVYSAAGLDSVRASDNELKSITVPRASITSAAKVAPSTAVPTTDEIVDRASGWNAGDLKYARTSRTSAGSTYTGGSVYVRGYTRKDGTYVSPVSSEWAVSAPPASASGPRIVMIIRHAEKPDDGVKDPNLSKHGFERAEALATVIPAHFPRPDFLIATKRSKSSNRPVKTITPLAGALHEKIESKFKDDAFGELAHTLLSDPKYSGRVVLIAWHHGKIPELAKALGAKDTPDKWKSTVFDRVWEIDYQNGTATWKDLPENALPGDSKK